MNHLPTLLMAAILAAAPCIAHAQQDFLPDSAPPKQDGFKYTLLKPTDKTFEVVKADERNPFSKLEESVKDPSAKGASEENQIREKLEKLRVVGVSPGRNGLRVMLGDIVLESGQMVPPLLPEQTVVLKVGNVTDQAIELLWMEERAADLAPRKLTIPVDLRPYVRYQLQGQPTDKNKWEKNAGGEEENIPVGRLFPAISPVGRDVRQMVQGASVPQAAPADAPLPVPAPPAGIPQAEAPPQTEPAALRSLSKVEELK